MTDPHAAEDIALQIKRRSLQARIQRLESGLRQAVGFLNGYFCNGCSLTVAEMIEDLQDTLDDKPPRKAPASDR